MTWQSTRPNPDDESTLVRRAKEGDHRAFADLIQANAQMAHRVAYLITRSSAQADDALQDGTVKAYRALDRFVSGKPFRPWFTAIVANEARNSLRSATRREGMHLRLREAASSEGPETEVLARERQAELLASLDDLPDRQREAVALRHIMGLSEKEAAQALGVRPGTVKSRVSRGLAALRSVLEGGAQ